MSPAILRKFSLMLLSQSEWGLMEGLGSRLWTLKAEEGWLRRGGGASEKRVVEDGSRRWWWWVRRAGVDGWAGRQ